MNESTPQSAAAGHNYIPNLTDEQLRNMINDERVARQLQHEEFSSSGSLSSGSRETPRSSVDSDEQS